jgi:glycerol kinase
VVERPRVIETTAMGAAMLAGVGAGVFADLAAAADAMAAADVRFHPAIDGAARASRRTQWQAAIAKVLA